MIVASGYFYSVADTCWVSRWSLSDLFVGACVEDSQRGAYLSDVVKATAEENPFFPSPNNVNSTKELSKQFNP
jgi:hypothetical protein